MKRRILGLFLLCSILPGCSTIRLKYDADLETQDGKKGSVSFEKSYSVGGGQPLWCGLTAIFLGGACWFYVVMPTVEQKSTIASDADDWLKEKLGSTPYTVTGSRADSTGWNNRDVSAQLDLK